MRCSRSLAAALLFATASMLAAENYRLGFSPGGSSLSVVLAAVASAKSSLLVACYEFTSPEIAKALEAVHARGVSVRVVADYRASKSKASQVRAMARAGIEVRLDRRYAIMHDKFMVIDSDGIETGSFNYTKDAIERNAENALWEWGVRDKASLYRAEWERLWKESGSSTAGR